MIEKHWTLAASLATGWLLVTGAQAQPSFSDHAVSEHYTGASAKPVLGSAQDKEFRTQLKAAAKGKANFAGHYILTTFGCGASCVMGGIIDARSGKISWLPFTVCCGNSDKPVEFRLDSTLLIVHGMRNEQAPDGTFYYAFEDGKFKLVAQRPE